MRCARYPEVRRSNRMATGDGYSRGRYVEQYYCGRFWDSFRDPIEALTEAGFPVDFAEKEFQAVSGVDVFVAFDSRWGVRLVYEGGRWDRWLVRFDPLLSSPSAALYEGRQLTTPVRTADIASVFIWDRAPRMPERLRTSQKMAHQ